MRILLVFNSRTMWQTEGLDQPDIPPHTSSSDSPGHLNKHLKCYQTLAATSHDL